MEQVKLSNTDSMYWNEFFPTGCIVASPYPAFNILNANDAMVHMLGYHTLDEMKSAANGSMISFIHPDDIDRIMKEGSTREGKTESYAIDYRLRCKNGSYRWVKQRSRHILDKDGNELIVAAYMDISDQKETNNIFRELADNLPGGVFSYLDNDEMQFKYVNPNFCHILGYSPEEFKEHFHNSFRYLVYEEDRQRVLKEIDAQIELSDYDVCEYRIQKKDGSLLWFSDVGHLTTDAEGNRCYYVTVTDITRSQLMADALHQAEQANSAKSDFLSRMSHDIRTPMNAIIGLTSLALEETDITPQMKEYLDKISGSSQYLLGLINDILDVSRIESGKMELHPSRYAFKEFKQTLMTVIETLTRQKGIDFVFEPGSTAFTLWVDKLRFNQIFINLLSNAFKFTPAGGKVELLVLNNQVENQVLTCDFVIRDNGIGMTPEFMNSIFEPFAQANVNTSNGSGLGLTIVRSLVDMMHGTLHYESTLGKGTSVYFSLPLQIAPPEPESAEGTSENAEFSLQGRSILAAEDNPLNMEILTRILEKKGITVIQAINGQLAIDAFRASRPFSIDAVLMDVRMPIKNGLEAAAGIRAMDRKDAKSVPIIALTANAYGEDMNKSKEAGMNEHLAKPVQPQLLFATLQKYLSD